MSEIHTSQSTSAVSTVSSAPAIPSTVYIVDDDPDMRASLQYLIRSMGITPRVYASASEFLSEFHPGDPGCLVCDVRMPELSGFDVVERLMATGAKLPIIFMTAFADVPMAIRALKSGAVEFIEKPFNAQSMLEKIQRALADDRAHREVAATWKSFGQRMESLTDKEREALSMILEGLANKVMAARLKITERAVEMRRSSIMHKLNVQSVAELIRMVTQFESWRATQ